MKTIQVVLDDAMLKQADREARRAKINRSALIREALAYYLERSRQLELEARHRRGYERKPVQSGEFDAWDAVQTWPEK